MPNRTGDRPPTPFVLDDDGGWCWFQGPRAIVHEGTLLVGSVAIGANDPKRCGDVAVVALDLHSGAKQTVTLDPGLEANDHCSPGLLAMPDGSILAAWTRHGVDAQIRMARSTPGDPFRWTAVEPLTTSGRSRVTYSNLARLEDEGGRMYDFFRGLDDMWKPSYAYSDDGGASWGIGGVVIDVPGRERHRPYVRYSSDGVRRIHMLYTDGHPRSIVNRVHHAYVEDGLLHASDGAPLASLMGGLADPSEGTLVFSGSPLANPWVVDLQIDARGNPEGVLSVSTGPSTTEPGHGPLHRYLHVQWDGSTWQVEHLGHAGLRLYEGEEDYTGLAALDPTRSGSVFISTNSDPATAAPLISSADGRRHWEIFHGTRHPITGWTWRPLTGDSTADNLRPIAVDTGDQSLTLLWLRGEYRSYTDYSLEIVGLIDPA